MKIYFLYIWGIILSLLVGCQREIIDYTNIRDIEVRVSANALTLPEVDQNTRAGRTLDENSINEAQLIVFDENNLYAGRYSVTDNKVKIPHTEDKRTIYVVANAAGIIEKASTEWTEKTSTMDTVLESLYQERELQSMPSFPFVMYAKLVFPNGINNNSAITSDGTHTGDPLLLKRNVAKISVAVGSDLSKTFSIKRLMLCKAPSSGYLIKNAVRNVADFDNYTFTETGNILYSYVASPETTIILEAEVNDNGTPETRYFKIAIKESQAHGADGLKQNIWYKITLLYKTGIGFATLEDAINGHVFDHIDTTLEVVDITMHDFVFGKGYFIATSNSHYDQYGHESEDEYYEICKVRFADTLDNENVLETTSIEVISGAIELDAKTIEDISQAKNHGTYTVRGKFSSESTDGVVRLKYNALTKDIYIKIRPELDLQDDQFIEMPYSASGIILESNINWCGINDEKIFTDNSFFDSNSPIGTLLYITLRKEPNLQAAQSASALFSRTKYGLTKVCIFRNPKSARLYLSN